MSVCLSVLPEMMIKMNILQIFKELKEQSADGAELSMGRVDPWVRSGWVEIFQISVGCAGSGPL